MFCSVDTCERPAVTRGLCVSHYSRLRKTGDIRPDVPVGSPQKIWATCQVDGCEKKTYAKGMCQMHYARLKRNGHTDRVAPKGLSSCSVKGCEQVAEARCLCHGHYLRALRGSALTDDMPLVRKKPNRCVVEGCSRPATARSELCSTHLRRKWKFGDPRASQPVRVIDGGGYIHKGYRYVPVPTDQRQLSNGRSMLPEHRLVMARRLGRALFPDESVHHINGERLDNRLGNLELWSRWQPAGQRVDDKLTWAREILERYESEALSI